MATSNLSFADIDKHMNSVDLSAFQKGTDKNLALAEAAGSSSLALSGFCDAYQNIRPLLVMLSNLPLLPEKWRAVIKNFINVADLICPR